MNFKILEDVIFREGIFEDTAAEGDPADGASWAWALNEMRTLWTWWTVDRPAREAEYDRRLRVWHDLHMRDRAAYDAAHPGWQNTDNPHAIRYSLPDNFVEPDDTITAWLALNELDDAVRDDEDTAMLVRLIRVRGYLWT